MKIQIRTYRQNDLAGLTHLMNQWDKDWQFTEDDIRQSANLVLKSNNEILIAAGPDQQILGYIFTVPCFHLGFQPFVEVASFLVDGKHRSLGIGEKLITAVEERARVSGFSQIKPKHTMC